MIFPPEQLAAFQEIYLLSNVPSYLVRRMLELPFVHEAASARTASELAMRLAVLTAAEEAGLPRMAEAYAVLMAAMLAGANASDLAPSAARLPWFAEVVAIMSRLPASKTADLELSPARVA